jgi:hypothetical protein
MTALVAAPAVTTGVGLAMVGVATMDVVVIGVGVYVTGGGVGMIVPMVGVTFGVELVVFRTG